VTFSVPVTPHSFRHSYSMHMLYNGIPLKVLQSLMGHKSNQFDGGVYQGVRHGCGGAAARAILDAGGRGGGDP